MRSEILFKLSNKENLTKDEALEAMNSIMKGESSPVQTASFLTALKMKGETVEEISGCAMSVISNASKLEYKHEHLVDCVGTGGDGANTFNISTTASFIAAGAGVKVAKHGNRSVSSKSGSADVLEKLGVHLTDENEKIKNCLDKANIGFMFAPHHHKSFKNVVPVRKELKFRTVFNILGPMVNPASVEKQIMGVYDKGLVHVCANVLKELGVKRAMVIHGEDGLDEITLTGKTYVSEIKDDKVVEYMINPEDYGFKLCELVDISGEGPGVNADILESILRGDTGFRRDIAILNAAAAIYISGVADSYEEGLHKAIESVDSGKAYEKLEKMRMETRR
ncbi:anthranilate phosphoribosyltransferase [Dethiosulfatibacter aminovorans DSM 17477]|uniref:Anthranilate phosphoribosyltransferase n=1 Tax=Dethiosulfatibacter aminovorans DSM 17477 TaxID=1121476 RepID=A0A1M6J938_9FIRM|nr:anthranilate phosphoribosyltransferase [Dethiosulfatibacter aminovorans]SHJ43203.1 anthranilate phosphoribosyltransferase [Dethiosulfatibacter aminovorans DSM 17477]